MGEGNLELRTGVIGYYGTYGCFQGLPATSQPEAEPVYDQIPEANDERPGRIKSDIQAYLLKLNPALRQRLTALISKKYQGCGPRDLPSLPRNCFETTAYLHHLDYAGKRIPSTDPLIAPYMDEQGYMKLLGENGYRRVAEILPFQSVKVGQEKVIREVDPSVNYEQLKPGDILVFGSSPFDKGEQYDTFIHAAVYLGRINGQHFIFEKPTLYCGPDSRYQIMPLMNKLKQVRGLPTECDNSCYEKLFVYRSGEPAGRISLRD